jgi:hypothetical protein
MGFVWRNEDEGKWGESALLGLRLWEPHHHYDAVRWERIDYCTTITVQLENSIRRFDQKTPYVRLLARAREKNNWVIGSPNYLISSVMRLITAYVSR